MVEKITNDFTVKIATVNGTGSQSANNILFKSLVRMGIPTSAKNLFPSNIQGLPTWFHIRTSSKGYESMRRHTEILVALNPTSFTKDYKDVRENTVVIYDSATIKIPVEKKGVIHYPVPLSTLSKTHFETPRIRQLLTNTIYLGVICELFGLDHTIVQQVIKDTFKKKQKVVDVNVKAVELGIQYVKDHLKKQDPYYYAHDNKTHGKIIMEGNQACALGAIFGGCTIAAWYPITPASSLSETLESYSKRFRVDPQTQKSTMAVVQAEDELSAIGMAVGAGWAGSRAMTGTSGPGISLMSEFIGLAYYAEVPIVIFNVQRVGPSTGLPTRTQQGDLLLCAIASHGDTRHILLFPGTIEEAYEMSATSFDIADRVQTPVFVMSDLELGMNLWMSDPLKYYDKPFDRGKVFTDKELQQMKSFSRYLDIDNDGITYRTLPGIENPIGTYFARGTGHTEQAVYSEDPEDYEKNMFRIAKKFKTALKYTPKPLIINNNRAEIGIITVGTTHHALVEARDLLNDKKIQTKYMRILSYPFHEDVKKFIDGCKKVMVVEANRDGQLATLIKDTFVSTDQKIYSIAFSDGLPIDPIRISESILKVAA